MAAHGGRTHTQGGRLVLTLGSCCAEESKRAGSPFSPYLADRRKRETVRHIPLFHLPSSNKRLGPHCQESWACGNRRHAESLAKTKKLK